MITSILIAAVIIITDTALMISYEFVTGLTFKVREKEVPWVYKNFEQNKFRSISAFTPVYFLAWLILAIIKFIVIEFFILGEVSL